MSEHTVYWAVAVGPYGPAFLIAGPFVNDDEAEEKAKAFNDSQRFQKYRAEVHTQRIKLEGLA